MADNSSLLDTISQATAEFITTSRESQRVQTEDLSKIQQSKYNAAAILRQVADDSVLIEYQKGTAELKAQNQIRSIATAGGINVETGAGTLRDGIQRIKENSDAVRTLAAKRRQELDVNLITNPLGWIKAQVDWNSTGHNLETAVQQLDIADKSVGAINRALQDSAKSTELIKEVHTSATVMARARIAAAQFNLQAEAADAEGFKTNSAAVIVAEKSSGDRLTALHNQQNATRLQAAYEQGLAEFKVRKEQWDDTKEARRMAKEAEAVGKNVDELYAEYINLSRRARGLPDLTPDQMKNRLFLHKKEATAEMRYEIQNGERIKLSGGLPMIASEPAEALEVLKAFSSNLGPMRAEVAALIGSVADEFDLAKTDEAKKAAALADSKSLPRIRQEYINSQVKKRVEESFNRVDGPLNMNYIGDLGSYLGGRTGENGITSMQLLPLASKVLTPAAKNGVDLASPSVVMGLTIDALRKGELTTSQAVSNLTEMYQRANEIVQAQRAYVTLGISTPLAGKTYNVRLGGVGGKDVDLTNHTEVGSYIANQLALEFYKNRVGGTQFQGQRTSPVTGQPYGR